MHVPPPRLTVARANATTVELSWPLPATGYWLQFKNDLNLTNWNSGPGTFPDLVFPTNDWYRLRWPQTNAATFFRLTRP